MPDTDLYSLPYRIEQEVDKKFFIKLKIGYDGWELLYKYADKLAFNHLEKLFGFSYDSIEEAKKDIDRFIKLSQKAFPVDEKLRPFQETGVLGDILIIEQ